MDPISAIGVATTAYNAIKRGFQVGKEIEGMSKDLGRWMGAIQQVKEGHNKAKGRSFGSVEEEALESFAALKKVINDGIEPKLIAFETDKYRESIDYEKLAYDFLFTKNYKIAVYDVYSELKKKKIYETWFISNEVNFDKTSYSQWVKKFNFL